MLFARLNPHVSLERADDNLRAVVDGRAIGLGRFGADAAVRSAELKAGLPLETCGEDGAGDIAELVRRLSSCGLLEYRLARADGGGDLAVVEPQLRDYVPRTPALGDGALALSRFAYLRRRGADIVLESPRSPALFRLCDPGVAAMLASLAEPKAAQQLRRDHGGLISELLAMLVDCRIVFALGSEGGKGLRSNEGEPDLVLWDFHDLVFHARSTTGRHANPSGGRYAYAHVMEMPPAVRPAWPGEAIDLRGVLGSQESSTASSFATLLRRRHSTRGFDDRRPITLSELSRFLDATARVQSMERVREADGSEMEFTSRPYPSGGASYELELYLAVAKCEGLPSGFYHYDAARHAVTPIEARADHLRAMLAGAQHHLDAPTTPQIVITIAARFGRVSWKYSAIAYALTLKHVGVLMQSFYLMATEMELGACAVGAVDIDLFARMTGVEFHIEGSVGQIAIGRGLAGE
ncbi:SagB family peptide dehydrogenase [Methylosinus sp. Sm6]|uniref:SagB/ThcOx family dehydrogenase n=1 Tax=Methylosinus sp. Sm6 TaxID=2866948 RepID=UPI001C990508|nr:SagB family peptide dehydrogenase [Methylosinus sp. Sm6]MBY6240517.1 SagB family peptide dehydrogenase [Methylosinus sp. Sm6]